MGEDRARAVVPSGADGGGREGQGKWDLARSRFDGRRRPRRHRRLRAARAATLAAAIGAIAAIALAGCGSSTSSVKRTGANSGASFYTGGAPGGTPVRGGKVVIDQPEAPNSLDPASVNTGQDVIQISEGLVETVSGSKEVQPDLATSWSVSPNHLTYTFHIREGVEFSNGQPLTGEDVVYSLERQKEPTAVVGPVLTGMIEKVSLAGPMTVQVRLKHIAPTFLADLAWAQSGIVSKSVASHEPEKAFALHPVGTGPFALKSATPGYTTIVMTRNPHYWRAGQPYLDELVWQQVSEDNARILAVRSGAANIALTVPFSQVDQLRSTPGVRLLIQPFAGSVAAMINDAVKPFNEADVRKALNYATPRAEIIKSVFKGLAVPANNFPTAEFKYYDPSVPAFPYDIAKAKALLKSSKVPNGFAATMLIYAGDQNNSLVASIIQSAWAKIGVHLSIQPEEPTRATVDTQKGTYQVSLFPSTFGQETYEPDIVDSLYEMGSTIVGSYYKSPRVTELLKQATTTDDQASRTKLFREVQRIVNWEEAAFLPIAFEPQLHLVSSSVRAFTDPPNSFFRMRGVWLAH